MPLNAGFMVLEVFFMKRELHAERLLADFVENRGVNDFNFFQKVNIQGVGLFEYLPIQSLRPYMLCR